MNKHNFVLVNSCWTSKINYRSRQARVAERNILIDVSQIRRSDPMMAEILGIFVEGFGNMLFVVAKFPGQ